VSRERDELNTQEIRGRILDASQRLFADKGYDATGISEIAAAAQVTKSLIYYYFESKDDILKAIFKRFEDESLVLKHRIAGEALGAVKDEDGKARLHSYIREFTIPLVIKYRDVIKIALIEEIKKPSEGPLFEYFRLNMQAAVKYYLDAGLNTMEDPDYKSFSLFMMVMPMLGYAVLGEEWCAHSGTEPGHLEDKLSSWIGELLIHAIGAGSKTV
jgi:AcrR family transcriptional regulator